MRRSTISMMIIASSVLVMPIVARAADGVLSLQPIFGKATYSDSDTNGFANATLIGCEVMVDKKWSSAWESGLDYSWVSSYDALSLAPQWHLMGSGLVEGEKGELQNQKLLIDTLYKISEGFGIGLGCYGQRFTATEPGYNEKRDYLGASVVGRCTLPKSLQIGFVYAPSLNVNDNVKGDWDNPDRTASVTYGGSYWELSVERDFAIRENLHIGLGLSYSNLAGEGADHAEYRFLSHDYRKTLFASSIKWSF